MLPTLRLSSDPISWFSIPSMVASFPPSTDLWILSNFLLIPPNFGIFYETTQPPFTVKSTYKYEPFGLKHFINFRSLLSNSGFFADLPADGDGVLCSRLSHWCSEDDQKSEFKRRLDCLYLPRNPSGESSCSHSAVVLSEPGVLPTTCALDLLVSDYLRILNMLSV